MTLLIFRCKTTPDPDSTYNSTWHWQPVSGLEAWRAGRQDKAPFYKSNQTWQVASWTSYNSIRQLATYPSLEWAATAVAPNPINREKLGLCLETLSILSITYKKYKNR